MKKLNISQETGLTPQQEQVAILLASGAGVTEVADKAQISRATIYQWQQLTTFKCFFNKQCNDVRNALTVGLFGLASEALQVIKECLNSEDDKVRLKTAIWITDKLHSVEIDQTDIITALKAEATYTDNIFSSPYLHEEEYQEKLQYYGLKEPEQK